MSNCNTLLSSAYLITSLAYPSIASADTINVPEDYTTIQSALDAASDGDRIHIAAGTYFEFNLNPQGKTITIAGAINSDGYPTVTIDGHLNAPIIHCNSNETLALTFKNLIITNGLNGDWDGRGGGMILENSASPTIGNCIFLNNATGLSGYGGAIYMTGTCAPDISSCQFVNNYSGYGGAVYCQGGCSPTFEDCLFTSNRATSSGGCIRSDSCDLTISGTAFFANESSRGGCISNNNGTLSIYTCNFTSNYAYMYGGGAIYNQGGSIEVFTSVFSKNLSTSYGGAIRNSTASCLVYETSFNSNTAENGGAIYTFIGDESNHYVNCTFQDNDGLLRGGAVSLYNESSPSFSNCIFDGNTSLRGGAIRCDYNSSPSINECTISNNGSNSGGGIYCYDWDCTPTLINSTLCGNTQPQIEGHSNIGEGTCISFSCNDSDDNGVPDECQDSTGDGIHEVPDEYETVQQAIEAASYGDTVLVHPGTWTGTGDWVINPGGKPITIRSSQGANSTILSGEGARNVIACVTQEDNSTVIDGFTITGGFGFGGGGVLCIDAGPTIKNCVIEDNHGSHQGGGIAVGGLGGAASSPIIANCIIKNNSSSYDGGGIYCPNPSHTPVLTNTTVCGNIPEQIVGTYTDNGGNTIADECPNDCTGDLDGNGEVGVDDLLAVLAAYQTNADGDCDGDGDTDVDDLLLLISAWGPCP